jgi:hypothetical protein
VEVADRIGRGECDHEADVGTRLAWHLEMLCSEVVRCVLATQGEGFASSVYANTDVDIGVWRFTSPVTACRCESVASPR